VASRVRLQSIAAAAAAVLCVAGLLAQHATASAVERLVHRAGPSARQWQRRRRRRCALQDFSLSMHLRQQWNDWCIARVRLQGSATLSADVGRS